MSKKNSTFFTPVVDATPSGLLFTTEEKALKEAQKMFRGKGFRYLKNNPYYKDFKAAVDVGLVYTNTYTVKE